jgi:hypothetical protein
MDLLRFREIKQILLDLYIPLEGSIKLRLKIVHTQISSQMLAQVDYATIMNEQKKQIHMGTSMKKISSLFAEDAKLIFVPTHKTYSGHAEIHQALEKDSRIVDSFEEKVISN